MKKFLAVAGFAAIGFAAQSAAACDWNREASAQDAVVATTTTATIDPAAQGAAPQSTSAVSEESVRKPVEGPAPIVLITNRD